MIAHALVNNVWLQLLEDLETAPVVAPRGKSTREHLGTQLRFGSQWALLTAPERKLNYRFAAAEALWILLGMDDVAPLARVNPKMAQFSDDGRSLAGAYGVRFAEQLNYVLRALSADPLTRQAIIEIWRPEPPPSRDIPCTLSWQFLQRDGVLHLAATMRSSDAWLGVPYDAFSFAVVLQYVAGLAGFQPGRVTMTLGSSHIYEEHWAAAYDLVRGDTVERRLNYPAARLELEPLADLTARHFVRLCAADALHEIPAPQLSWDILRDKYPGWRGLVAAVAARTSAEALERLRGC